ncbi:pitrilysin family protein [Pricia sp. S334]|uniref:Pitrilysin family protein n=1 Tax=Pricia mediterranea TaxID=3076079 RepID=A0ABU3L538_9FLAO|nr:pitrilysin family protein [Pricia sp. S334]MDT7828557.1 pitrilysin family protein [Pricia sp. S334]
MKKIYTTLIVAFLAIGAHAQIDRSQMPESGPAPEINLEDPQTFEMKNGLKVLVVENHKLPRVSIQLRIDNAPVPEGEKVGVASLTGSLLGKGSKNISKDDFNEEVDFLGARISFGSQGASASALSKYFPRILELMADAAIHPEFTQEEFEKEKQKMLTGLKTEEKDVKAIARNVSSALAYTKKHPYGEFPTETSVNKVTLEDVKRFYDNQFLPANAYLVVVGDVKFEKVKELVEEHFTPWTKGTPPFLQFSSPSDALYSQINFVNVPNAVQSEITAENLVELKMKDPDYLPALLANEILGGGGEGRLFLNLREDKGYTYGSYSRLGDDKYAPARFRAVASVRNAVTDSSVVELLKEIENIRKEPVSQEELENTKAKYSGRFVMALENPQTIARYALNIETENLPEDFYKTYLERLNAVTVEEVQEAAQKYIKPEHIRVVVTGKASEVLPNLENISYNGKKVPVKYFDKNADPSEKPQVGTATVPEGVGATEVLKKYIEAIGGKEKLEQVEAYAMLAEAEMQGMQLDLEIKKTTGGKYMQDIKVGGNSMSKQVFDGSTGYMMMQGQRKDLGEDEIVQIKAEAVPFPELDYLKDDTITLEGMETIEGQKAYELKLSDDKSAFYDAESGLKVQETTIAEMGGQPMTSTINYGNYQEVSGIKFPFTLAQTVGPQSFDFKVTEVKVNEGVSDSDFK